MSYSDFSFKEVSRRFGLSNVERDWFGNVPEVAATPRLQETLDLYYPLARAISTEKARSEFLIAPVLAEVLFHFGTRVSLFSGIDFPADPDQGLNGVCDFLFARSGEQQFLTTPVVAVVEAKNENLRTGLGQCVAEMVGARIFNAREKKTEPRLFGVVTTGELWQFLYLEENVVGLDARSYHIMSINKILGILATMLDQPPGPSSVDSPNDLITPRGSE